MFPINIDISMATDKLKVITPIVWINGSSYLHPLITNYYSLAIFYLGLMVNIYPSFTLGM